MRTGALIVYTSADSVFQIAAHEEVVPVRRAVPRLRDRLRAGGEGLGVGRVIARPFVGTAGQLQAHGEPARLRAAAVRRNAARSREGRGVPVVAIGKIEDLFAGRGITRAIHTASDDDGMDQVMSADGRRSTRGLIFANLVDFDTQYGHRNDVAGYAANLERFDGRLAGAAAASATDRPARS